MRFHLQTDLISKSDLFDCLRTWGVRIQFLQWFLWKQTSASSTAEPSELKPRRERGLRRPAGGRRASVVSLRRIQTVSQWEHGPVGAGWRTG